MGDLPYDLLQMIFNGLDFISQLRYHQMISFVYVNIHMTNFGDIEDTIITKLSDEILVKYPHISKLNASSNRQITNVNHLRELQELIVRRRCGICQNGISELQH